MPFIYLLAFRGVGLDDDIHKHESLAIRVGHVGVCFQGEEIIYGFHPTSEAVVGIGGEDKLINQLGKHIPIDGKIYDDTDIFLRAYELSQQGAKCRVGIISYEYDQDKFLSTRERFLGAYNNGEIFQYNFPPREDTPMSDQYDNCATFPRRFDIPIPEQSGRLKKYMIALGVSGGKTWTPKRT